MASSQLLRQTIIERLPLEIASEIFVSCTPPPAPPSLDRHHHQDSSDFQYNISIPLTLSSVCRLWRSIAHSTPALWTSFRIYIPSSNCTQRIKHAQDWLSRSGQLPLSIHIYRHPSLELGTDSQATGELISLVNSYLHRGEMLEIAVDVELLPRFCAVQDAVRNDSASILKTLILSPSRLGSFGDEPGLFNMGASNVSPTCVVLSPRYTWPFKVGICWNNVAHFKAHDILISDAIAIFRLSPQLQECSLEDLRVRHDNLLPSTPILLARLETLQLSAHSRNKGPNHWHLFSNITLPSLKHLTESFTGNAFAGRHILPLDTMVEFLNRSGCSLKTLSLHFTHEGILPLLYALPHLESLSLLPRLGQSNNEWVMNILADTAEISSRMNDQPHEFLPNLRSLSYLTFPLFSLKCDHGTLDGGTKEHATSESAESNQRPLRSFILKVGFFNGQLKANIIEELKRLGDEEGYEIQVYVDGDDFFLGESV